MSWVSLPGRSLRLCRFLRLVPGLPSMHTGVSHVLLFPGSFLICLKADFPSLLLFIGLCSPLLVWKHSRESLRRKRIFPYQLGVVEQTLVSPCAHGQQESSFPTAQKVATWGLFVSNRCREEKRRPRTRPVPGAGMFPVIQRGTSPLGNTEA